MKNLNDWTNRHLRAMQQDAEAAAKFRCHEIAWGSRFDHGPGIARNGDCTRCGASISVRTDPRPNEIHIGGEAVAVTCTAPRPRADRLTWEQCRTRYPRLTRAMMWAAVLSESEAACAIRDFRNGYAIGGGEAVAHFGGPAKVVRAAIQMRHRAPARRACKEVQP